jgi:hypothetical protein
MMNNNGFDPAQWLDENGLMENSQANPMPVLGGALGGGALGGGLGALFAKLIGKVNPAVGLWGAVPGAMLGGIAAIRSSAKREQAAYNNALAQLTPEQQALVMQEYGNRMHNGTY